MDSNKHQQFAERLVRNQDRVFRYIVSMVGRRSDAEDLFQQTCLTLWEHWERYDPALDFFPWACGIAYNHIRNFRRKHPTRPIALDEAVVEQLDARSRQRLERPDARREALQACLEGLASEQRRLIERYYGGWESIEQLAQQAGATSNAIYKSLGRIRASLHACIARRLAGEGLA